MPSVRIRLPNGLVSLLLGLVLSAAPAQDDQDTAAAHPETLRTTLSRLPLYFVENQGLYPDEVAYVIQGSDKTLYFTRDGVTTRMKNRGQDRAWVVKLVFVGARPDVVPRGEDRQAAVFSYFRGPEKDWEAGLATFSRVVYPDLWPGIDLVYRGTVNQLKYEFVVRPGADPDRIRLRYEGATRVHTTDRGALAVETPAGGFEDAPPAAWQEIEGRRSPVAMAYALAPDGSYGFTLGDYDATRTLVLDPAVLVYCGFIGGTGGDGASGIAVDLSGNVYVTGDTDSDETTFPVKVGPDPTYNGCTLFGGDAFVAKVNAAGTALIYCGFIGGADADEGKDIAVDAGGNAYVVGTTRSTESSFPVKMGPDLTCNDLPANGVGDVFVARVNASGTALDYCGYIGGAGSDRGYGIAVDHKGNAYVTGETTSTQQSFPVTVGPDLTYNSTSALAADAFVARVNAAGTALDYCGYIGGSQNDVANDVAVDAAGNAYVAGATFSDQRSFPVKTGPDLTFNGGCDAFVARVNATGNGLIYCGYIGGTSTEECFGIAVDVSGNAFVTGWTVSSETTFPVTVGPDLTFNGGGYDAYVAKVNASGTGLVYCGYVGGSGDDFGEGLAVDISGNVYVAGETNSDERTFPVTAGPDLTFNGGGYDAYVAKVNASGTGFIYCGYIGGCVVEWDTAIALDVSGNAYVTGRTFSDEKTFPVKVGPDLTYNGNGIFDGDAFVAKIAHDVFTASGVPRIGSHVDFSLLSTGDSGLSYQVGTSFGTGPIPIDTRQLNLCPDTLLVMSLTGAWPQVFESYAGMLGQDGRAAARLHIPTLPALVGLRLHTAFVTLDAAFPSGIKTISSTVSFTVVK